MGRTIVEETMYTCRKAIVSQIVSVQGLSFILVVEILIWLAILFL